jgi:hypothetical protein
MPPAYVPDAGDIVWINFDPRAGMSRLDTAPPLCSARLPTTPRQVSCFAVP